MLDTMRGDVAVTGQPLSAASGQNLVAAHRVEPDPFVGGVRSTRAAVERWEWRPVFEVAQLARRPAPGVLAPSGLPEALVGADAGDEFLAVARRVGSATVRGRLPRSSDPERVLADAAGRLRRSSKRPELDAVLRSQVAWMVADRVGLASADRPPSFDPSGLAPRERWERLQDVLDPARRLTAALGVKVGVDLTASPLPRMEVVDDRVVPAGRHHRLPRASFEQLPVGRWVSVGPYTEAEWAARGEVGSGRGAFLRLNASAYVVAVDHGDAAAWRLEDVAARTGHGQLAAGSSVSLKSAQADAVAALADRYPVLAPGSSVVADNETVPVTGHSEWRAMPGEGRSAAELRHLDDDVTVYAIPGPGGRWMPAVHHGPSGSMERLASTRTIDEARTAAELAGHRTIRAMTLTTPTSFDAAIAALAAGAEYSRSELVVAAGPRLEPQDRERLATAEPPELVELLGEAGVSAASTVAVLDAERVDPQVAAGLLPTVGVPISDGIRVLHERWEVPRATAATWLGATAVEMRDAGCSAAEVVALRPVEVLRSLPDDADLWRLAAATMTSGHPPSVVAGHLVSHAPSLDAFASGLSAGIEDPSAGLGVAAVRGANGEQLSAASEAYGLSPKAAAVALMDAGAEPSVVLDMVSARCEHDLDAVTEVVGGVGIDAASIDRWLHPAPTVTSLAAALDGDDAAALLAALPTPSALSELDPAKVLDAMGLEPSSLEVITR